MSMSFSLSPRSKPFLHLSNEGAWRLLGALYVDLTKMNGHRAIVTADGSVELDERNSKWAGAATRDWHHGNKTLEKIATAARSRS